MTHLIIEAKSPKTPEYVFLTTLLHHMGVPNSAYTIACAGGKDVLPKMASLLHDYKVQDERIAIIFDADKQGIDKGGYTARSATIHQMLQQMEISADLFLFPNNQDDGCVETLLEQMMNVQAHEQWLDCYRDYELCLGDAYNTPNLKGKLHTYISSQKTLTKKQYNNLGSGQWLFDDSRFWNLEAEALDPLKAFLKRLLEEEGGF